MGRAPLDLKPCARCLAAFRPYHRHHVYCSPPCKEAAARSRAPMLSMRKAFGMDTGMVGAFNELRVAADLMLKGWHVFRSLGPNGPCDLVALADGRSPILLEVTSAYERGELVYASSRPRRSRFDVLALALPTRIVYRPELPALGVGPADGLGSLGYMEGG